MKILVVLLVCLAVGCFGERLNPSQERLLKRYFERLLKRQQGSTTPEPAQTGGSQSGSGNTANPAGSNTIPPNLFPNPNDLKSWISANIWTELAGQPCDNVTLEEFLWEVGYLVELYIMETAGNYSECVYLGASMALAKTMLKAHTGPVFMSEVGGLLLSQSLKIPSISPMKALQLDLKAILPELLKIYIGPMDNFTEAIKNEIMGKLGVNMTELEETLKQIGARPPPPPAGSSAPPVETVEHRIEIVIKAVIRVMDGVKSRNIDPNVCLQVPLVLLQKLDQVLNITENLNFYKLDNMTAKLLNMSAYEVYPIVDSLYYFIVNTALEKLYTIYYHLADLRYQSYSFVGMLDNVLRMFFKQAMMRDVTQAVTSKLEVKYSSEFTKPIVQLDIAKVKDITTDMLKALHRELQPNDPCLNIRLLAGVAGVAQMDRFKLLDSKNEKIKALKTQVVDILRSVNASINVEIVKVKVDQAVAGMYLERSNNFIWNVDSMFSGEHVPSKTSPLETMKLAATMCKNNTGEVIKTMVRTIVRHEVKDLECELDPYPQMDQEIRMFVEALNYTDMYEVFGYVYTIQCSVLSNQTCVNDSNTASRLLAAFMELYPAALAPIVEQFTKIATLIEANPTQAMEQMRNFAADHMAHVIFDGVRGGDCQQTARRGIPARKNWLKRIQYPGYGRG